jgi:hypothetical protein
LIEMVAAFSGAPLDSTPAPSIFGTWAWNGERTTIDPTLERYRCYIERIEDLGSGTARMREHRIRSTGQSIRNDVRFTFGTVLARSNSTTFQWRLTGPTSYQMITADAQGQQIFVVTRDILDAGKVMRHIGEGVINGVRVRNEQYFDRRDDLYRQGECSIE